MAQVLAALDKLPKPDSQTRRRPIAIISNTLKGIGMIPGVCGHGRQSHFHGSQRGHGARDVPEH